MNSRDIQNLSEAYLSIYDDLNENVSSGKGARARSGVAGIAPIPQRVTASQAAQIRADTRKKPEPQLVERPRKEPKGPTTVPSRGIGPSEPLLRRRTPEGHRKRGASPVAAAKRRARLLSTGRDTADQNRDSRNRYGYARMPTVDSKERAKRIRAALKKSQKWGTPRANAESYEYLISYLLDEGYASNFESAEVILNSMSEGWKTDALKSLAKGTQRLVKRASKSKFTKKVKKFAKRTALGALGVPLIS